MPLLKNSFDYHDQSAFSLKAESGRQKMSLNYIENTAWAENEREEWEDEKATGRN